VSASISARTRGVRHGTALVEVAPIAVPQPDGSSKAGAGAVK